MASAPCALNSKGMPNPRQLEPGKERLIDIERDSPLHNLSSIMRNLPLPIMAGVSAVLAALIATSSATCSYRHSGNPRLDEALADYNNFASCIKCHDTYALNAGDGSMLVEGMPTEYTPGQTYTITVTLQDPGSLDWGYEFVVTDAQGNQAGMLLNEDVNSQIRTSSGREFASHKNGGLDGARCWNWSRQSLCQRNCSRRLGRHQRRLCLRLCIGQPRVG